METFLGRGAKVPSKHPLNRVMLKSQPVWDRLNRRNMSQNDLAKMLDISSSHLSRLINGRRGPSPSVRRRLMEVLRISEFDEIFVVVDRHE